MLSIFTKNNSPMERRILAITDELYRKMFPVPDSIIGTTEDPAANMKSLDKFHAVHEKAMNVLQQLEDVPLDILKVSEEKASEQRRLVKEQSRTAVIKQRRYDVMLRQMKNHFFSVTPFKRVPVAVWRKKEQ